MSMSKDEDNGAMEIAMITTGLEEELDAVIEAQDINVRVCKRMVL